MIKIIATFEPRIPNNFGESLNSVWRGSSKFLINYRKLEQRRFQATHVNQKWSFCILGQCSCPNFQAKILDNSKFGSVKAALKGKKPHFRLTWIAKKRLCSDSPSPSIQFVDSLKLYSSSSSSKVWMYFDYSATSSLVKMVWTNNSVAMNSPWAVCFHDNDNLCN